MVSYFETPFDHTQPPVREAVAVFTDRQALEAAVAELETTAFPRQDISVQHPADPHSARAAEDDPDAERAILIRPEEKTIAAGVIVGGGAYAGAITAAFFAYGPDVGGGAFTAMMVLGAVAGASLGGMIVQMLALRMRRSWSRALRRGGMVLWVRTPKPESERTALEIMNRHGGRDVHVHTTH